MLNVTLLSNAGLLLTYEGTTLLLDSLFDCEGTPFSNVPVEVQQQLFAGQPPFQEIDYLLFTHAHPDHFSLKLTLEFLKRRKVRRVFLPNAPEIADGELLPWLQAHEVPYTLLSDETSRQRFYLAPNLSIQAFQTRHLDQQYAHVRHLCYLLTFGAQQALFTADFDYTTENLAQIKGTHLRAAFVNPLFFSALRHNRFFQGELEAEHICVYHVPFEKDDRLRMRAAVQSNLTHWDGARGEASALWEPQQKILL